MAKYNVELRRVAYVDYEIEARSEDEAIEIAESLVQDDPPSPCGDGWEFESCEIMEECP